MQASPRHFAKYRGIWYNVHAEREHCEVSLTGLKVRPVFGKAKP